MIDFGLKMMDFIAVCGRGAVRRYHQRPVRPGSSALARVWEIYDERHVEGLSVHGCNAVYSRPGYTNGKRWRGVCKWCACPAAGGGRAPRERSDKTQCVCKRDRREETKALSFCAATRNLLLDLSTRPFY